MSLIVASAQLRGQPLTAILNLWGIHDPQPICSILMPRPVESCVPKRHHSDPTQVFTVRRALRSEEQTSELQSLMRISYAVFCLKKKNIIQILSIATQCLKTKPKNRKR